MHERRRRPPAAALGAGLPAAAAALLAAAPVVPAALVRPASAPLGAADAAGRVGARRGHDGLGGRAGAGQLRQALPQGGGVAFREAAKTSSLAFFRV